MMSNCPHPDLCPETVYRELGTCHNCCACFPEAEALIAETELKFIARDELTSPGPIAEQQPAA